MTGTAAHSQGRPFRWASTASLSAQLWIVVAYAVALLVALFVWMLLQDRNPIGVAFAADVAATVTIFLFSFSFSNSSFYDPYWSVAPIPIAIYWATDAANLHVNETRTLLAGLLLTAWAVRLTFNWWRGWRGLDHEDWRYIDLAEKTGPFYWIVSFLGIHLFPTIQVFLGCIALFPVLARSNAPLGWLDLVATLITAGAIALEATADRQLHRFRESKPAPEAILSTGLWGRCRHPNYLGENLFWWGLWLFAMAADTMYWWTIIGPLMIGLMFRFVSLPMIENRMLEKRPAYAELQLRIPILIPRIRHRG